ncbi:single-stranded DNA-binding protein [Patescibacteria group bacterium]|nr:single-stranded DNA-binding protein [Patescibacteria group bacterium]MBU1673302.1 single-stranded DNA-binding protein [Patescibacteria group bacterium]MBU1963212.1 single-stranded DNA-binding protein [Patescibacteria group bacterium]
MDLNKVMLIGRVTQDPELRTIPSGHSVVSFGLATNRRWKDQQGQMQDQAEFSNIVAWRKLAETISQYVKKGSRLYVEGRLQTRNWEDQNGVKKYRTEIVCDTMIMLDSKGAAPAPQTQAQPQQQAQTAPVPKVDNPDEEISVEDIPF